MCGRFTLSVNPEAVALAFDLDAFPAERMVAYPVSALVNSPRNDVPECIAPLD